MIQSPLNVCASRNALKIAIFVSPSNTSSARAVMVRLCDEGHECAGLKFNDSWRNETRARMDDFLAGASHFLFVANKKDSETAWFSYAVGLARGRSTPFALYTLEPDWIAAAWIDDVLFFKEENALADYYAVEHKEWDIKEARRAAKATLLELGISWHSESLAQCVRDGECKAVELFLESGFPVDVRDKTGVPMLCLAARHKHRGIVELLLSKGADINALSDDRGYTALMDATQQGETSLVDYLLEQKADPNIRSKDGQTALILAVGRNDATMVTSLLANGADPEATDKLGLSAIKYAKLFNNTQIVPLFLPQSH